MINIEDQQIAIFNLISEGWDKNQGKLLVEWEELTNTPDRYLRVFLTRAAERLDTFGFGKRIDGQIAIQIYVNNKSKGYLTASKKIVSLLNEILFGAKIGDDFFYFDRTSDSSFNDSSTESSSTQDKGFNLTTYFIGYTSK